MTTMKEMMMGNTRWPDGSVTREQPPPAPTVPVRTTDRLTDGIWPDPTYEDMSEALDMIQDLWEELDFIGDLGSTNEKVKEDALQFLHRYGRMIHCLSKHDYLERYCY